MLENHRDCEPIELGLGRVAHSALTSETLTYPSIKIQYIVGGKRVVERQHRHAMAHLGELVGRRRADALRRRVGRHPLWMCRLQLAQLLHEPVVLGVRHLRLIEDVVAVVVLLDLAPQFSETLLQLGLGGV